MYKVVAVIMIIIGIISMLVFGLCGIGVGVLLIAGAIPLWKAGSIQRY